MQDNFQPKPVPSLNLIIKEPKLAKVNSRYLKTNEEGIVGKYLQELSLQFNS